MYNYFNHYPALGKKLAQTAGRFRTNLAKSYVAPKGKTHNQAIVTGTALAVESLRALAFAPTLPLVNELNPDANTYNVVDIAVEVDGRSIFRTIDHARQQFTAYHDVVTQAILDGVRLRRTQELNLVSGITSVKNKDFSQLLFVPELIGTSSDAVIDKGTKHPNKVNDGMGQATAEVFALQKNVANSADFITSVDNARANPSRPMPPIGGQTAGEYFKAHSHGQIGAVHYKTEAVDHTFFGAQYFVDPKLYPLGEESFLRNTVALQHVVTVFCPKVWEVAGSVYTPSAGLGNRVPQLKDKGGVFVRFTVTVLINKERNIVIGFNYDDDTDGANLRNANSFAVKNLDVRSLGAYDPEEDIPDGLRFIQRSVITVSGERTMHALYNQPAISSLDDFYALKVKLPSLEFYENSVVIAGLHDEDDEGLDTWYPGFVPEDDFVRYARAYGLVRQGDPLKSASLYLSNFRDMKPKDMPLLNVPL